MGRGSVNRRIAFGAVKEIDKPLSQCGHWLDAIKKGDLDPCDAETAKAAGVPLDRIPKAKAAKAKAD